MLFVAYAVRRLRLRMFMQVVLDYLHIRSLQTSDSVVN